MCLSLILTYFSYLIDKAKSLSQGDVHDVNKPINPRRIRKSSEETTFYTKLFNSFGKGKNRRKKAAKPDIRVVSAGPSVDIKAVSADPITQSNDTVNESTSGTSEESSRTVSMYSDTSNYRASLISQDSFVSVSSEEDFPDSENVDKKCKAAREILSTEKTYNKSLILLKNFQTFIDDLNREELIVPINEFTNLFSNLMQLRQLSDLFLDELKKRIENWDNEAKVADIFAKNGQFLKLYYQYTEDYTENGTNLEKLKDKYPKFKKAVSDFEAKPECQNLKISSYFLNPVQRLPRYKLLLENYLKKLNAEEDLDYQNAVKALEVVSKAADHVNRTMAQSQSFRELMELQSRFTHCDSLIQPSRSLLYKGKRRERSQRVLENQRAKIQTLHVNFKNYLASNSCSYVYTKFEFSRGFLLIRKPSKNGSKFLPQNVRIFTRFLYLYRKMDSCVT